MLESTTVEIKRVYQTQQFGLDRSLSTTVEIKRVYQTQLYVSASQPYLQQQKLKGYIKPLHSVFAYSEVLTESNFLFNLNNIHVQYTLSVQDYIKFSYRFASSTTEQSKNLCLRVQHIRTFESHRIYLIERYKHCRFRRIV